ncbi:MAG: flavodoxin-dependent (E)-4-hydroxy-3-methylbut-2-enyl-diphosphate synthase [Treponemataceae bacterium]
MYKKTKTIILGGFDHIKKVAIGADNPIAIQTMWKEDIISILHDEQNLKNLIEKINCLEQLGCQILRFAVPTMESAEALIKIAEYVSIPLVADIHFNYKLALRCLDGKIAKIRINPGNIGSKENALKVVKKCQKKAIPIRIGVNSGSLPKDVQTMVDSRSITNAQALVLAAEREMDIFSQYQFDQFLVSLKASNIEDTVRANQLFAQKYDVPLHVGVTEAGPLIAGVVKSTVAFSALLPEGIGSTIRVSLSSDCKNEIIAAKEILRSCNKYSQGVEIISCPRCGRNGFDVHGFLARWQERLESIPQKYTIAVMGCVVNGPGEAKHADLGISGVGDSVIIFKRGKIIRQILAKDTDIVFNEELNLL